MAAARIVLLTLPVARGAFSSITPSPTCRSAAPVAAPLFSASTINMHPTVDDEIVLPRLDVVSEPRAVPKGSGSAQPYDFGDLFSNVPKRDSPKGPSVFKLNQGRAIDILRHDYPLFFARKPDLSIFTKDVELHDSSGKRLSGLRQYEKVFDLLLFLRRTTMQDAEVTYRVYVVDEDIRVRWSAKLWMRDPALGLTSVMGSGEPAVVHVDGVSIYELDYEGKVCRHRLENILLRGRDAAEPVQLAFAWPHAGLATPAAAIPFFRSLHDALPAGAEALFSSSPPLQHRRVGGDAGRSRPLQMLAGSDETPMERAARERAEDADKARKLAELRMPKMDENRRKLFSLPQPCESSFDCEQPEVCCDLLFGSVCCSGGLLVPKRTDPALQEQAIPIPVPVDRDGGLPPGLRGGNFPPRY